MAPNGLALSCAAVIDQDHNLDQISFQNAHDLEAASGVGRMGVLACYLRYGFGMRFSR
jgi:hypothetical protein